MKVRFDVPIYDVSVWIVVDNQIYDRCREMDDLFGTVEEGPAMENTWRGQCACCGADFGLFFHRQYLDLEVIAHEVFHLTHHIMDYCSVKLDIESQEAGAFLNGYLMGIVMRKIQRRYDLL